MSTRGMTAIPDHGCLICGQPLGEWAVYPATGGHAILGTRFERIGHCPRCGLGTAVPRISQESLDAFYASGGYWHATGSGQAQRIHEKVQSKLRVSTCLPYLPRGRALRVLDVGAGHAWTADWLARLAPVEIARFDFIEPDQRVTREVLQRRLPFEVIRLSGLPEAGEEYDLLFLNHVLEHVADPVGFMRMLRGRLRGAGIAYVETPNSDHRFKEDVFPHTFFFTARAFHALGQLIDVEQLLCEEFGSLPAAGSLAASLRFGVSARLFHWSLPLRFWPLQEWLDRTVWRYDARHSGMWLRWIIRRPP